MKRRTGLSQKYLDHASMIVIVFTFILFASSLATKGLSHDLFLETGVLLVSVKLILNAYQMDAHVGRVEARIEELRTLLQQMANASAVSEEERA
ncbi:MAG TPA: hypothetical protein VEP50_17465 [bacterium]|nr:hypothetical protein [bacterium]